MPRRRPSDAPFRPLPELAHVAWKAPLLSLPIALFFVIVTRSPLRAFWEYWRLTAVLALTTMLVQWVVSATLEPRLRARLGASPRTSWWLASLHLAASVVAIAIAALVLNVTWLKGFLGDPRVVAMMLAYTVMFGAI